MIGQARRRTNSFRYCPRHGGVLTVSFQTLLLGIALFAQKKKPSLISDPTQSLKAGQSVRRQSVFYIDNTSYKHIFTKYVKEKIVKKYLLYKVIK